ncbi:hypothetical protein JRI60_28325 [Archangium violaceum]|uniref:hypothetical protein n=1 Tax=Archangium violaceum TaxID=83451 RepID=UPI00194DFA1C|nr:hypothetical protein [Archangium violaceum]QRN93111.1 hypothetical protein JRI60_28325 [Archangium violaceum]
MRRVGTVRLAARSDALVRRGALLLEDALRTASFPDGGPGRVLLIRSLRVGVIQGHLPPASLALSLEQRVRELAISAVYAGEDSAAHRDAVFFRDDAEPTVALARRLVRGAPVTGWFWPLAVPGFHPSQPRDESLRLVLATALRTSAGPAAAMRLVETLHAEGGLDLLLGALRWHEGPVLLQSLGSRPPGPVLPTEVPAPGETARVLPSAPLRASVARWVETWGAEDARSVWLTAVALVLERWGRLADVRLVERAARLAAGLVSGPARTARGRDGHEAPPSSPVARGGSTEALPPEGNGHEGGVPSADSKQPTRVAAPEEDSRSAPSAPRHEPGPAPTTLKPPASSALVAPERPAPEAPGMEAGSQPRAPWPEVPLPTVAGGLLFLVPVLERLGISTLLEEHPSLLELDLTDRLLSFIAERLGVPATDPSRVILETHLRGPRPVHCPFALPERLRTQVAIRREDAPLAFHEGGPLERTVLTDATGRLPLAVTYGVEPGGANPPPERTLAPALRGEDDLGLLLLGLRTAARRWCRRYARLGLHELVRRPGRITATRTHVDVLFDIQQADIRVRSAGLDVDPGWVPWLGRVVRFHYLHGES